MDQPNVLFVFGDQWTFWALGYAGNPEVRTPNLDRFAAESVNCVNAISSCPVCTPARASLLTGLRPDRHGLFVNDAPLDPDLPSFGKHFADAGYDTAYIGKWHVDGHGRFNYIPPERRRGFQYFKALECTHNYPHSRYYANDDPERRYWEGYDALAQTDDLIGWLRGRETTDRPFCAVLSWGPPHNPYHTAPEEYRSHYEAERLTPRGNVPDFLKGGSQRILSGYYAHCEALDAAFGKLMETIDSLGGRDQTVVVFTSDHGDMLCSHGLNEKQGPWDEALRIPYLIRAPWALPAGSSNETFLEFGDSWPTIASLCGIPVQDPIQARDLSEHLANGTKPQDNYGTYASYVPFGTWPLQKHATDETRARAARGLRTERYLYVESLDGPWLLYDCQTDPLQLDNRINDPSLAPLRTELSRKLHARLAADGDEFLAPEEYIRRWGYEVDDTHTIPIGDWTGGD